MPALSEATDRSTLHLRPRPTRRGFLGGALLVSIAIHTGIVLSLATVVRTAPESGAEPQPSSIPVSFVELAPAPPQGVESPSEPVSPDVPAAATETSAAIAPAPPDSSAVAALPIDPPQPIAPPVEPSAAPVPAEPAEPAEPTEPAEPLPEAEITSPSPEASPEVLSDVESTPDGSPPSSEPDTLASSPSLPNLPPSLPGNPDPSAVGADLDLPQVAIAETVDPVEITASVSIQANTSSSSAPPAEQSDRQTFTYDPTGASGLAIATCPFVPDILRYAGETVTLQVQLNDGGTVQAAEVYKASTTSAAYETFATCLVENWDFSRLPGADMNDVLLVSITIETSRS